MGDEDGFVVVWVGVDGHEGELEELERQRRLLPVLVSESRESLGEVVEKDGDELVGDLLDVRHRSVGARRLRRRHGDEERLRD